MLHGDKLVFHGLGLFFGGVEGCVHIGADIEAVGFPAGFHTGDLPQLGSGGSFQAFHRHVHFPQQLGNQPAILPQQSQQQMHLLELLVRILHSQILCALDSFQRFLGILIEVHSHPSFRL